VRAEYSLLSPNAKFFGTISPLALPLDSEAASETEIATLFRAPGEERNMPFDSTKGFEPKKALENWKKAKPILLKETGISDLLRALPEGPAAGQLPKYLEIQGKLKAKMADPSIRKESKAVRCIQEIVDEITGFLKFYKDKRAEFIHLMTLTLKEMKTFQTVLEANLDNGPTVRRAYDMTIQAARQFKVGSAGLPRSCKDTFPKTSEAAWTVSTNHWFREAKFLVDYLGKKPAPDPKAQKTIDWAKGCKHNLDQVIIAVGMLKPI
jgi:hypothetical protein